MPDTPEAPAFDYEQWRQLGHVPKVRPLVLNWTENGGGTPPVVHVFYVMKMAAYVIAGVGLIWLTSGAGNPFTSGDWWTEPIVYQKAVVFTMLIEVMGFGGGAGPLNFRFQTPFVAFRHWFRVGTIRQPPWPKSIPGTDGDTRTVADVALFAAFAISALVVLFAPHHGSPAVGDQVGRLSPWVVAPMVALLPIVGLRDKTIFLAARAEMYWVASVIFLFPQDQMMIGLQLALLCIWWGAGVSKLTHLFPYAVSAMISNAPLRPRWFKRMMYRNIPDDIRPSRAAFVLTHAGTAVELGMPFFLLFAHGPLLAAAVAVVVLFHLHILSNVPLGVPNEWNIFMIFGVLFLFWAHRDASISDLDNPLLIAFLLIALVIPVIIGNFRPDRVSFLIGMRYYAANWAISMWCFRDGVDSRLGERIVKATASPAEQLATLLPPPLAEVGLFQVRAWRSMHPQGRAINGILTQHFGEDLERYTVQDGELLCGSVMGWNFGDGHLHDERLLASVQKRCQFGEGELIVVILESQPLHRQRQHYRIVDAAAGRIEEGYVYTKDMLSRQPDDPSVPLEILSQTRQRVS